VSGNSVTITYVFSSFATDECRIVPSTNTSSDEN